MFGKMNLSKGNKMKKNKFQCDYLNGVIWLYIDDDGTLYGIKNGDIDFEFIDSIFPSYSN